MAEKLHTKTLNIPSEVVDSDWRDDIDTDYATREDVISSPDFEIYGNNEKKEGEYISPKSVSRESIREIKSFQEKLAFRSLKAFRQKEQKKLAAAA